MQLGLEISLWTKLCESVWIVCWVWLGFSDTKMVDQLALARLAQIQKTQSKLQPQQTTNIGEWNNSKLKRWSADLN